MQRFLDAVNRVIGSSDAPHPPDQEAYNADRQVSQSTGKLALIVDDDPLMRWVLCEHLRQHNFSTLEVATAADGYAHILALRERVSILITDMILPGGGGWQLVQRARSILPELAVVFISGAIDAHVVTSASSHPRTGFLEKPFELSHLTALLTTLLSEEAVKKDKYEVMRAIERNRKAG